MKELILGGARSGKSALAEKIAREGSDPVLYVATAHAGDEEMERRIERHRSRRSADWELLEEPLHLAKALKEQASTDRCVLVDCLTLWLSNLLVVDEGRHFQGERDAFLELLPVLPGRVIFVGNEVGMGIVPMGELTRRFQDESGWLHQEVARHCDRVILTVAGLAHLLKGKML